MPTISDPELPIGYVKITGPAVDALENRKEIGSTVEISEAELRESYLRVREPLIEAIRNLCNYKFV